MIKKIVFTGFIQLSSLGLFSQADSLFSSLIAQAIDSSVVVLKSDYLLRDTSGEDYVRTDNYYTRTYGLGVIGEGRLHTPSVIVFPWRSDNTLKRLDLSNGKKPVLSQVVARPYTQAQELDIELFDIDTSESIINTEEVTKTKPSLTVSKATGMVNALIVLYSDKMGTNTAAKRTKTIYERVISIQSNSTEELSLDNMPIPNNFLGGLMLNRTIKTGAMTFEIIGLVYANPVKKGNTLFYTLLQTGSVLKRVDKSMPKAVLPTTPPDGKKAEPSKDKQTEPNKTGTKPVLKDGKKDKKSQ